MRTKIDEAGRVAIPKGLRDAVGLLAGDVEVTATGSEILIEPVTSDSLVERDGRLVIPASGSTIRDELVQAVRDAEQR